MTGLEAAIGRRIALLRKRHGWTQQEMAEMLTDATGTHQWSRQAVWSAERGERAFAAVELVAFASVFDVSLDTLCADPDADTCPQCGGTGRVGLL